MILRSVTQHVKDQNWFAVVLDLIIVVLGVFIGIQFANINEARAFTEKETGLLAELKRELEFSVAASNQKGEAYSQVAAAGQRSLDHIAGGVSCGSDCWPVLVDFFHASQWQQTFVRHSTYDEMRRLGLPRSREIIDAVESFLAQNANISGSLQELPVYRSLVRQLIPLDAQAFYWATCFDLTDGEETYVLDCPRGVSDEVAARTVEKIISDPDIELHLTEWIGNSLAIPPDLAKQNIAAGLAIDAIDQELKRRKYP